MCCNNLSAAQCTVIVQVRQHEKFSSEQSKEKQNVRQLSFSYTGAVAIQLQLFLTCTLHCEKCKCEPQNTYKMDKCFILFPRY